MVTQVTDYGTWDLPGDLIGANGLSYQIIDTVDGVQVMRLYAPGYAYVLEARDQARAVAGIGWAWRVTWSTDTTASDPGTGGVKLNAAAAGDSTEVYIDDLNAAGQDMSAILARFGTGTSTVKGALSLRKRTDETKWVVAEVTVVVDSSGYRTLTIQNVVASGAAPFSSGEELIVGFVPNGDKGDTGNDGDVVGPGSSTDNAWARWNGTAGTTIQNGQWVEDDNGDVTAGGYLDMNGNDLTVDFTTVEAAGEHAEENAANATGVVTIQATDPTVLRRTLTGDVTLHVAGAPTPGKGWSTELRTTQDGTGGRDVTILPANELTYSANLQTTAEAGETRPWGNTNTSLSLGAAVGPDGRENLTKIIETAVTGSHFRNRNVSAVSPAEELTISVILRGAGDGRNIEIAVVDTAAQGNQIRATVNPDTGGIVAGPSNIGNGTGATLTVTDLPNSCYRFDITGTPNTSGTSTTIYLSLQIGTTSSYAGDGTSGLYVGNVQLNTGQPIGMIPVATTRAASVVWRAGVSAAIDYTAQAAATESRIILGIGSDGEIMVDDVSVEA